MKAIWFNMDEFVKTMYIWSLKTGSLDVSLVVLSLLTSVDDAFHKSWVMFNHCLPQTKLKLWANQNISRKTLQTYVSWRDFRPCDHILYSSDTHVNCTVTLLMFKMWHFPSWSTSMMHWLGTLPLHSYDVVEAHNPMRSFLAAAKVRELLSNSKRRKQKVCYVK